MHQQRRLAFQLDDGGVGQDRHAGTMRVVVAEQEIAIAADEIDRHAAIAQPAQLFGDVSADVGRIVVADPGFEQVAEDVERACAARFLVDELAEQLRDVRTRGVEMQVGNE